MFYERVSSLSTMGFDNEINLLNKGLTYNIKFNSKICLIMKSINKSKAIRKEISNHSLQNEARVLFNCKVCKHFKIMGYENRFDEPSYFLFHKNIMEFKVIEQQRKNLRTNNSILNKVDKGNTAVLMYLNQYIAKVHDAINNDNIQELVAVSTNKYVKNLN